MTPTIVLHFQVQCKQRLSEVIWRERERWQTGYEGTRKSSMDCSLKKKCGCTVTTQQHFWFKHQNDNWWQRAGRGPFASLHFAWVPQFICERHTCKWVEGKKKEIQWGKMKRDKDKGTNKRLQWYICLALFANRSVLITQQHVWWTSHINRHLCLYNESGKSIKLSYCPQQSMSGNMNLSNTVVKGKMQ